MATSWNLRGYCAHAPLSGRPRPLRVFRLGPRNPEKIGERDRDSMTLEAIRYSRGSLQILDQLLLPQQSRYEAVGSVRQAWEAIRAMKVESRGGAQVAVGVVPLTAVPDAPNSPSRCAAPQPLPSWAA